jgi:hypothetical protein
MGMAGGARGRQDVRYRVGRWLGSSTPRGIFAVLLLGSVGFPLATWLEWARGGLDEPLGIEIALPLVWLVCVLLAYAWWFFARESALEASGEDDPVRRGRQ